MPIRTRNIDIGAVSNETMASRSSGSTFSELPSGHMPARMKAGYCFEDFKTPIEVAGSLNTGAAAVGTTGAINVLKTKYNSFQYFILGAGQTIVAPVLEAAGLLCSLDLVDNEGAEYNHGVVSGTEDKFTIGTDEAFFVRAKLKLADVSGADEVAVGFRKVQANGAAIDDYDDMAALNVILGDVKIETIVGDAATVTTDTTNNWLDTETHTLQVNVSSGGVVTYMFDEAAPTTVAAYTFTSALEVMPFFHFLHATTTPGAAHLVEWEWGYQDDASY